MDGYTYEQYEAEQERLRRIEARRIWEEENADDIRDMKLFDSEYYCEEN